MILLSAVAVLASADMASSQVKFGAGYSMSPHNMKSGDEITTRELHGFNIGLVYDANFIDWNVIEFGVTLGVNYELLTDEESEDFALLNSRLKTTLTEHYVNVPLHLNFGLNIPNIFGVYAFAGPTFSFGVSSSTEATIDINKARGRITYNNYNGQFKVENISDEAAGSITDTMPVDYGWFDVKLGAGVGIEIANTIDLKAGYNWGLMNRYTGDTDGVEHHSDQFYVTLSYIF